jgi:hypothetical protein
VSTGLRVRHIETGLTNGRAIEAWIKPTDKDGDVLVLTGAALRADRIPELVAMLNELHAEHVAGTSA